MKRLSFIFFALSYVIFAHAMIQQKDAISIIEKVTNDSISEIWAANQQYADGDTIFLWNGNIICPFKEA